MPEEPEDNAEKWLEGIDADEFTARVVPVVERWLDEKPDMRYEDDYVDEDSSAQGSALVYFRSFGYEESDALRIAIVEGDRPGSNNSYAQLEGDIDQANKAAARLRRQIWFK
jgi:hypothetical protein